MSNNIVIIHYVVYLIISTPLVVWVGKTLFKNGRIFLVDSFNNNEPMVDSVNHLITVGFYLLNFGIVSLFLRYGAKPGNFVESIELMSTKIGIVLLLLVVMHFLNVYGFAKMRGNSLKDKYPTETDLLNPVEETDPEGLVYSFEMDDQVDSESAGMLQPAMNSTGR